MPEWIQKGVSHIDPLFSMNLLILRNERVYIRNSLAFIGYGKAFDKVKRHKLFRYITKQKMLQIYY